MIVLTVIQLAYLAQDRFLLTVLRVLMEDTYLLLLALFVLINVQNVQDQHQIAQLVPPLHLQDCKHQVVIVLHIGITIYLMSLIAKYNLVYFNNYITIL